MSDVAIWLGIGAGIIVALVARRIVVGLIATEGETISEWKEENYLHNKPPAQTEITFRGHRFKI